MRSRIPLTGLVLLLCGCVLGLLSLFFCTGSYGASLFSFYLTQPVVLVLNLLPYVLLIFLLFGLTNRPWISFSAAALVCLLFSWAQYWKLAARNDPIYAEDLAILSEAIQMSGSYIRITPAIIVSALAVICVCVLLFRFFSTGFSRKKPRIFLTCLTITLSCWLYPNVYTNSGIYDSLSLWPQVNQWFETSRYISRGGIYPFLYSVPSAVPSVPDGYSEKTAAAILNQYDTDDIPVQQQVSIIMVMFEAFSDLSDHTDAITGTDPYAAYHALQSESYTGKLVTNIFAGGTIDTERSILTGFPELGSFRRPSWSYARYFSDQGYTVNGAHAGYAPFYNRSNVNENLGISDYRFIEGYYETLFAGVPTDQQLLSDITEVCLRQMESGPVFSFNVTYQNHGPYDTNYAWFYTDYVPQGNLSDSDYHIINNYLVGIEDTCYQMAAMANSFRECAEPVVLVFFGDHKPWLGEQSATYAALGIDIASQSADSFLTYYSTDYLIWANDAAKALLGNDFIGTGPTISPCFLMNVLFGQCGWSGPSYLKLTNQIFSRTPLVHATGQYLIDGIVTAEDGLPTELSDLLTQMEYARYYLSYDSSGILP